MDTNNLVLIVADNLRKSKRLIAELRAAGYSTEEADTIPSVWRHVYRALPYAIAIFAYPESAFAQPLDLCRELTNNIPSIIILLFQGGLRGIRAQAFANGVDQCFNLPGCSEELIAYLDAQKHSLRHVGNIALAPALEGDCIQIDTPNRRVYHNSRVIDLTSQESAMLELLARREGQAVSVREISHTLWRSRDFPHARASSKHCIMRLRRKIEVNPREPRYLLTVRGLGYRLQRAMLKPMESHMDSEFVRS